MAGKEGSVAPKERINIVYRPETGGQQEEVELPFRFMVLGDFTGREDSTPVEERPAISIDKDNFDDVLAAQNVQVNASVPEVLTGDAGAGRELAVSLSFKGMKDFSPDALCQQVPELRKLVDLRDALSVLKGPLSNIPGFRKRLEAVLDDPAQRAQLLAELGLGSGSDE
jgi:type VI secretion system protein ImpB